MTEKEFVKVWVDKFREEIEREFPDDFIPCNDCESFENNGKRLLLGAEFFGSFELIDANHNSVLTLPTLEEAKYFIYASRQKPDIIRVPKSKEQIINAVKAYDEYLDNFLHLVLEDFQGKFSDSSAFNKIAAKIFLSLDLQRF